MVLGKLPVPGRPTILITVGQGPIALAVGAGGDGLDIFTFIYPFSSPSPSLWETARYRLKYCLKGPLNPEQPTNQLVVFPIILERKTIFYVVLFASLDVVSLPKWDLLFSERMSSRRTFFSLGVDQDCEGRQN